MITAQLILQKTKHKSKKNPKKQNKRKKVGWLGFYGMSTFVGYLTPNQFL